MRDGNSWAVPAFGWVLPFSSGAGLPMAAELPDVLHGGSFTARLVAAEAVVVAKAPCAGYDRTSAPPCRPADAAAAPAPDRRAGPTRRRMRRTRCPHHERLAPSE